ncbi:MAG TPA: PD-(D/E)XK nuclease family protein [Acidimicrobiales bacterium]|nr:PD-(D/E)XK nuclease family protein [Acidimicrobiales bacterium]
MEAAAIDEVRAAIASARAVDPFAPVVVLVPTAAAGVSLRRRLASGGALFDVRALTVSGLAEFLAGPSLASPGRGSLSSAVRRRAIALAVSDAAAEGAHLGEASTHPATIAALDARFRELRRCAPASLASLRSSDDSATLLAVFDRYRERVAASWFDDVDVVEEAARAVASGSGPVTVPHVVVSPSLELSHPEQRLIDALVTKGAVTSAASASTPAEPLRASRVAIAPDPEAEVRVAIREVLRLARDGLPFHRIAIAYPGEPYVRLLRELLDAAGVPWSGRGVDTLATTATGRALRALLALPELEFSRAAMAELFAAAPIVDPSTGSGVPSARWDRLAREANVVARPAQWRVRLERLSSSVPAAAPSAERLARFVEGLVRALDPPAVGSWSTHVEWVIGLLDTYVATVDDIEREAVVDGLRSLAGLDALGSAGPSDVAVFVEAVEAQLSIGFGRRPMGTGVLLGTVRELAGAATDAVIVVGMNEGTFPPRRRDDPLLPDVVRSKTSGDLPTRRERRAADRRQLEQLLRSAEHRILLAARADQRAQQQRNPSRWLLEWAPTPDGRPARRSTDIAPVASFSAVVLGDVPASAQEAVVHALAAGASFAHAGIGRSAEAVRARHSSSLSEWDGLVGRHPALSVDSRVLSPTAVETWASCPFQHFLHSVLRVDATHTPEDRVGTDPLERGTLVHEVLERLVEWRIARGRPAPLDEELEVLDRLIDEVCEAFESAGRVGRAVPWTLERRSLRADLAAIVALDAADVRERGLRPVQAEAAFGMSDGGDDLGVVAVALPDGRTMRFRGKIDRVDASSDGHRVRVTDYKTGRSEYYRRDLVGKKGEPPTDPTAAGRRLQLPVYALALAPSFPDASISAEYWFVTDAAKGYPRVEVALDDATRRRFLDVLTQIADAIDDGIFPGHPGEPVLDSWGNCRNCDYDRVCPSRRGEAFERKQGDDAIVRFLGLKVAE